MLTVRSPLTDARNRVPCWRSLSCTGQRTSGNGGDGFFFKCFPLFFIHPASPFRTFPVSASPSASRRLASSLEEQVRHSRGILLHIRFHLTMLQMRALLQGLHGHPSAVAHAWRSTSAHTHSHLRTHPPSYTQLFSLPESGSLVHCVARAHADEGVFPARHAYADFDRLQAFLAECRYKFDEHERESMPSVATVLRNCEGGSTSGDTDDCYHRHPSHRTHSHFVLIS